MRVLLCIPSMRGGGAERQLVYLAAGLRERGWKVHVALVHTGPNMEALYKAGAEIHRLYGSNNYDPRILFYLWKIAQRFRPDVIHTWLLQMDILGGSVARWTRTPWVLSERSSHEMYPESVKNKLRVLLGSRADAIVANSSVGHDYWRSRVEKRVVLHVVGNGLPLEEIESAKPLTMKRAGCGEGDRLILFAGRFSAEKNVGNLLLALELVLEEPGTVAALCGELGTEQAISRILQDRALMSRILLPGYITNIWRWMKRASVLVSVGLFEGHPNAVLEAMACGCPIIVSDIPAHREFLDESCALLVNPHDPAAIAEAIKRSLSDPCEAQDRAMRAKERAMRCSIADMARQYEQVYLDVLARSGSAQRASIPCVPASASKDQGGV